jgi:hypothetical protein
MHQEDNVPPSRHRLWVWIMLASRATPFSDLAANRPWEVEVGWPGALKQHATNQRGRTDK